MADTHKRRCKKRPPPRGVCCPAFFPDHQLPVNLRQVPRWRL